MIHPRTYILTIFLGVSQWIHFSMVVALTNSIIVIRQLFFFSAGNFTLSFQMQQLQGKFLASGSSSGHVVLPLGLN